jgi:hypothetical protein
MQSAYEPPINAYTDEDSEILYPQPAPKFHSYLNTNLNKPVAVSQRPIDKN